MTIRMRWPICWALGLALIWSGGVGVERAAAEPPPAPVPGASPDFDGDGRPDLAIGGLYGGVQIRYGDDREQELAERDLGSEQDAIPGEALLARDVNGDGYADLLLTDEDARELLVLLGGPSGLIAQSVHRYPAPSGARTFGHAIALVTKPAKLLVAGGEQTSVKGGSLAVYPLGSDGLPSGTPFWINQNSAGVPGTAESGDEFGFSLAAEGSTLVVGVPGEDIGKVKDAGNIVVLTYTGGTSFSGVGIGQNSSGVADKAENNDQFGHAVAIGNGYLAVGVPGESSGAGMVQVFTAAAKPTPKYTIDQNSKGVPGGNERGDLFGASVALARLCSGKVGVVVGAPGEQIGVGDGAGWVVPFSRSGSCPSRLIVEGPGEILSGSRVEGGLLGSSVTTLRAPGAATDTVVLGGSGIEDVSGSRVYTLNASYTSGTKAYAGPAAPYERLGLSPLG